jgi:hypothetical protein
LDIDPLSGKLAVMFIYDRVENEALKREIEDREEIF